MILPGVGSTFYHGGPAQMVGVKGYATIQLSSTSLGIGNVLPGAYNTASAIQDPSNINAGIVRINFTSAFVYPPVVTIQPVRVGVDWLAPGMDPFMPDGLNTHRNVFPLSPIGAAGSGADTIIDVPVAQVYGAAPVTSITRVGTVATVTTPSAHGFNTGDSVVIEGAIETAYNGIFVITSTGIYTFTYTVAGTPSTPATGTITAVSTAGRPLALSSRIEIEHKLLANRLLAVERDHMLVQFASFLGQVVRVQPYYIDGTGLDTTDDYQHGTVNEILFGYTAYGDLTS